MQQRIITGILFTIGVLLFVIPSYWVPEIIAIFAIIVGGVSFFEMNRALKAGKMDPSTPLIVIGGIIAVLLIVVSYFFFSLKSSISLYCVVMFIYSLATVVIPSIYRKDGNHIHDGLISAATVLYVTFPMYCLIAVTVLTDYGFFLMIPALFSAWVTDVFAYFTGVTIGKHKIVPHISPKKTWEGCIGGSIMCAIAIALYFVFIIYDRLEIRIDVGLFAVVSFLIGFVVSVMSQLGDWLASLIKRRVGIKDYGDIFPGHGGMIDRFDSVFFTVPCGVLLALVAIYFT